MYITNLEDDLQDDGTKLNEEKGRMDKKPLVNFNHSSKMYEKSGSENDNIEENEKGENEKNTKESTYTNISSYEE